MKRIKSAFLLAFLFACFVAPQIVYAQQRTVTGTVTSEDGLGLPGVSVSVKGTTIGAATDIDGKYALNISQDAKTLVFSSVGMQTQEITIGASNNISVVMKSATIGVDEVVVTALGISREKKSLGYAVQDVKGDDLVKSKNPNVINALSGKVAGVQITGSGGTMGGSSRILIRGASSITNSNNQPLYVIDGVVIDNQDFNSYNTQRGGGGYDYGSMAQDINPDDIESISVLRGANATALYGSRAGNGAIIITTKKGKKGEGKYIGVDLSYGLTLENVSMLPKYQKLYGGGAINTKTANGFGHVDINGTTYNVPFYKIDESWGPKYDANIQYLPYWSIYDWEEKGKPNQALETVPWVYAANPVKTFFETGFTHNTNVAISGGDKNSAFRLGYTNLYYDGYLPNSKMKKNSINVNVSRTFIDRIEAFSTANYIQTEALGRPETGYGDNNIMVRFSQWGQTQLDMEKAKRYMQNDGTGIQRTWNRKGVGNSAPEYSNNPYWTRYMDYQNDMRHHLFGNVGLKVEFFDWLELQGKINMDYYNFRQQERIAIGSTFTPYYGQTLRERLELNKELLLFVKKSFGDISLNLTLGTNRMDIHYGSDLMHTEGGLVVKELYTIGNSAGHPFARQFKMNKRINSVFGSASIGYKGMLFVDLTERIDWSSALPKKNQRYQYPSVTTSFLFSELSALKDISWLSLGKVRLGWAQVGNDTDPYQNKDYYNLRPLFGTDPSLRLGATLNNPDLKAETTNSWEVGLDLNFLKGRAFVDFTYYSSTTYDQIISLPTSAASGYSTQLINAGEVSNKGIELMLGGVPIKLDNGFEWEATANFSKNTNKVVELAEGVNSYRLGSLFGVEVHAVKGKSLGEIIGANFVYDKDGNKVVGTNGRYLNGKIESVGSVLPDFNLGFTNTFRFKGIDLSILLDYQKGGKLFSLTNMWGTYSGILEETAATNDKGNNVRDAVANGGGLIVDGVYGRVNSNGEVEYLDADGNPSSSPVKNTTYVGGKRWARDHYARARAGQNTFDAGYLKLREVRLGYTLPSKFTGPLKSVNIGVYGRNLAIWGAANQHIDPETTTSTGNVQGIEGGQLPSLRSYGFNVSVKF